MIVNFYIFGYELIQCSEGPKCILNVSFKIDGRFQFFKHSLDGYKETKGFFESVGIKDFSYDKAPGSCGMCEIQKDDGINKYLIKKWIKKGE